MHLHTYRDESRSWHLDLIGGRGRPWSIDLVVNSFGHHVDWPRLRLLGIADPIAYGTAAPPGHRASRGGWARKKLMAAAYAAGRFRSRKQKDADQQTCCECPQA